MTSKEILKPGRQKTLEQNLVHQSLSLEEWELSWYPGKQRFPNKLRVPITTLRSHNRHLKCYKQLHRRKMINVILPSEQLHKTQVDEESDTEESLSFYLDYVSSESKSEVGVLPPQTSGSPMSLSKSSASDKGSPVFTFQTMKQALKGQREKENQDWDEWLRMRQRGGQEVRQSFVERRLALLRSRTDHRDESTESDVSEPSTSSEEEEEEEEQFVEGQHSEAFLDIFRKPKPEKLASIYNILRREESSETEEASDESKKDSEESETEGTHKKVKVTLKELMEKHELQLPSKMHRTLTETEQKLFDGLEASITRLNRRSTTLLEREFLTKLGRDIQTGMLEGPHQNLNDVSDNALHDAFRQVVPTVSLMPAPPPSASRTPGARKIDESPSSTLAGSQDQEKCVTPSAWELESEGFQPMRKKGPGGMRFNMAKKKISRPSFTEALASVFNAPNKVVKKLIQSIRQNNWFPKKVPNNVKLGLNAWLKLLDPHTDQNTLQKVIKFTKDALQLDLPTELRDTLEGTVQYVMLTAPMEVRMVCLPHVVNVLRREYLERIMVEMYNGANEKIRAKVQHTAIKMGIRLDMTKTQKKIKEIVQRVRQQPWFPSDVHSDIEPAIVAWLSLLDSSTELGTLFAVIKFVKDLLMDSNVPDELRTRIEGAISTMLTNSPLEMRQNLVPHLANTLKQHKMEKFLDQIEAAARKMEEMEGKPQEVKASAFTSAKSLREIFQKVRQQSWFDEKTPTGVAATREAWLAILDPASGTDISTLQKVFKFTKDILMKPEFPGELKETLESAVVYLMKNASLDVRQALLRHTTTILKPYDREVILSQIASDLEERAQKEPQPPPPSTAKSGAPNAIKKWKMFVQKLRKQSWIGLSGKKPDTESTEAAMLALLLPTTEVAVLIRVLKFVNEAIIKGELPEASKKTLEAKVLQLMASGPLSLQPALLPYLGNTINQYDRERIMAEVEAKQPTAKATPKASKLMERKSSKVQPTMSEFQQKMQDQPWFQKRWSIDSRSSWLDLIVPTTKLSVLEEIFKFVTEEVENGEMPEAAVKAFKSQVIHMMTSADPTRRKSLLPRLGMAFSDNDLGRILAEMEAQETARSGTEEGAVPLKSKRTKSLGFAAPTASDEMDHSHEFPQAHKTTMSRLPTVATSAHRRFYLSSRMIGLLNIAVQRAETYPAMSVEAEPSEVEKEQVEDKTVNMVELQYNPLSHTQHISLTTVPFSAMSLRPIFSITEDHMNEDLVAVRQVRAAQGVAGDDQKEAEQPRTPLARPVQSTFSSPRVATLSEPAVNLAIGNIRKPEIGHRKKVTPPSIARIKSTLQRKIINDDVVRQPFVPIPTYRFLASLPLVVTKRAQRVQGAGLGETSPAGEPSSSEPSVVTSIPNPTMPDTSVETSIPSPTMPDISVETSIPSPNRTTRSTAHLLSPDIEPTKSLITERSETGKVVPEVSDYAIHYGHTRHLSRAPNPWQFNEDHGHLPTILHLTAQAQQQQQKVAVERRSMFSRVKFPGDDKVIEIKKEKATEQDSEGHESRDTKLTWRSSSSIRAFKPVRPLIPRKPSHPVEELDKPSHLHHTPVRLWGKTKTLLLEQHKKEKEKQPPSDRVSGHPQPGPGIEEQHEDSIQLRSQHDVPQIPPVSQESVMAESSASKAKDKECPEDMGLELLLWKLQHDLITEADMERMSAPDKQTPKSKHDGTKAAAEPEPRRKKQALVAVKNLLSSCQWRPGEAGIRVAHSTDVRQPQAPPSINHGVSIKALDGRIGMMTTARSSGRSTYGRLSMGWTTQVPSQPVDGLPKRALDVNRQIMRRRPAERTDGTITLPSLGADNLRVRYPHEPEHVFAASTAKSKKQLKPPRLKRRGESSYDLKLEGSVPTMLRRSSLGWLPMEVQHFVLKQMAPQQPKS